MAKKIVILSLISLAVFSTGNVFADKGPAGMSAVGLFGSFVGNGTGDTGAGLGLLFSWNAKPLVGLSWSLSDEAQRVGVFADWWVWDAPIQNTPLKYWVAVGLFGGLASVEADNSDNDKDIDFDLGARLPVGIRFFPISKLDLFLELVPMVRFLPEISFAFSADIGLRVHF